MTSHTKQFILARRLSRVLLTDARVRTWRGADGAVTTPLRPRAAQDRARGDKGVTLPARIRGSRRAAGCRRPRFRRGRTAGGDNNHESGRRPRRSLPGTAALGCRATAATGGRCAPGASRTAGRGEDCTGPRGCRKVRRVVSRLKRGGRLGFGGDSPRPWRPLRSGGPVSPVP